MVLGKLKRLAGRLPLSMQQEMRRHWVRRYLRRDYTGTMEPEFAMLSRFVREGDWALDIGANVGYYAKELSRLVGPRGHVIAMEPIAATAEILMTFARDAGNITVIHAAAGDAPGELLRFSMPDNSAGLPDYFRASVSSSAQGTHAALQISVDSFALARRVAFVKVDVEGAEHSVLRGMRRLIERDHPVMLVECEDSFATEVVPLGYTAQPRRDGSPNLLFLPARPHSG